MAFRLKKNQYWFRFTCTACGKAGRYALPKGQKFTKSTQATLKCTECAWGGPGGLKKHGLAAKRASRAVADLARRSTGCSPGPEFFVQLWATEPQTPNKGVYTFDLGEFEGSPVKLQVLIRGQV